MGYWSGGSAPPEALVRPEATYEAWSTVTAAGDDVAGLVVGRQYGRGSGAALPGDSRGRFRWNPNCCSIICELVVLVKTDAQLQRSASTVLCSYRSSA